MHEKRRAVGVRGAARARMNVVAAAASVAWVAWVAELAMAYSGARIALAQAPDPRDAEIFGEAPAAQSPTPAPSPTPVASPAAPVPQREPADRAPADARATEPASTQDTRPASGQSTPETAQGQTTVISDKAFLETLAIGGRVELRATLNQQETQSLSHAPVNQLRQAYLYFDSRPNEDIRSLARIRLTQDVVATQGRARLNPSDPTAPADSGDGLENRSGSADSCGDCVRTELDELWIKWDVRNRAFVTLGKQHLKWGSGQLWNPTDFTALQTRDPFALFDRRLGQSLVKLHVPVESLGDNYYVILQFDDVERADDIAPALRGEFTFLGSGELALSFQTRRDQALRFGADVSTALGPVDVHVESAFSTRQKQTFYKGTLAPEQGRLPQEVSHRERWYSQVLAGVDKTWKYSDEDNLTVGAEYFYNELGYDDRRLALYSLLNGQSQVLYSGIHYGGVFMRVPNPGRWNKTSFYLNGIQNFSDDTALVRLTTAYLLFNEATIEGFVSHCTGDYGELCFRVPESYKQLAQSPALPAARRAQLAALPTTRTRVSVGLGVSLNF